MHRLHFNRRGAAFILALLMSAMLLLTIGFMFAEIGHYCPHDHCSVCLTILTLQVVLKQLGWTVVAALALARLFSLCRVNGFGVHRNAIAITPVSLNIRMNN